MFVVWPVKRRVSTQKYEQNYSDGPQVAFLVIVLLEHFRGNVVRRSEFLRHLFGWIYDARCSEVDDGHLGVVLVLVQKQVFWLHVPVHDVALVTVSKRGKDLLDYVGRIPLAERVLLRNAFEQLPASAKLSD